MRKITILMIALLIICIALYYILQKESDDTVPHYTYTIINTFPHDNAAFTQGLVFYNDFLYESTGLYGRSSLRKIELETGKVIKNLSLSQRIFAEGITIYNEKVIQITWRNHKGFVYDSESFDLIGEFTYPMEGWGITYDGEKLIISDGSSTLYFLDPETFKETDTVEVHDNGVPVSRLNELEYIEGEIYANVWQTDRIARISAESGRVVGWIDLEGLLTPNEQAEADVLNGIAYDAINHRLFITGKFWPTLFEIDLIPMNVYGNIFLTRMYRYEYFLLTHIGCTSLLSPNSKINS
jgi:glutamine cyclotransferase